MASTVLFKPGFKIVYNPGAVVVDLSCFTVSVELTPNVEDVDVGTYCAPTATDQGRVTYSASATMLWEPALYTTLTPQMGRLDGLVQIYPRGTFPLEVVRWTGGYVLQPWGRFEVGQRVEVELPLAVLDTPVWFTG